MKRVFAFVGFSVAITLIVLNIIPYNFIKFMLLPIVVLFAVSLSVKPLRQGKVMPVTFGSILFACLIFIVMMQGSVLPQKSLDSKTADSVFKIVDIEQETNDGYIYTIKTSKINLPDSPQNIKIKMKTQAKLPADYYDDIYAKISFYSYTDNAFDSYGDYADGIYIRAKLVSLDDITEDTKPPSYYILMLRTKIKEILTDDFDKENAGLAFSLLTGDKSILDDSIRNDFRVCGISHMIAVSGLHITLICLLIYYLLKFMNAPPLLSTSVTFMVMIVYIGVSGYSKSALRAGIMIAVMLTAKLVNSKADTLNSLGFAVLIMCLNPFAVTDAGALLTVTSVLGLCVIKPAYDEVLRPNNKLLCYLYDGVFTAISVLLSTLPVCWLLFKRLSLVSLFLNIICIPIMQIALVSVLLLGIFYAVPYLAFLPKHIADFTLGLLINVSDFCDDKFSVLYLDISDEIIGVAIAGLLLFTGISLLVSNKVNIKIISAFTVIIFSVAAVFSAYNYKNNAYVCVSSSGAAIVYDKDSAVILGADSKGDNYFIDDTLSVRNFDNVLVLDSDFCREDIMEAFPNADFDAFTDSEYMLCDHITVKYNTDVIFVSVYDKVFKIDDDCVTIGEYNAYRNIYEKFNESSDLVFIVAENANMQVKKER
ncbi:MAG: ComEC/Rec2 family competence protein [Eubacterium sp.]|nr:ComEC/Rec2 family competence protein [Eubacterium sp.]